MLSYAHAVDSPGCPHKEPATTPRPGLLKLLDIDSSYRATVWPHTLAWLFLGVLGGGALQQIGFIVKKIGGSPALVTLVMIGPYVASLLAIVYVPWLERREVRALVAIPRLLGAGLLGVTYIVSGPIGLGVVFLIAMIVSKVGDTFYGRLLGQMYPLHGTGRMLSLPMFVNAAAAASVAVIAGWILKRNAGAYEWLLPACGAAGVMAALIVWRIPVHRVTGKPPRVSLGASLRQVAGDKAFLRWVLIYSFTSIGFWFSYSALPVFFEGGLGFGYLENGIAVAAFNASYCLGFLVGGRFLDRFRSLLTIMLGWSLVGVGTLMIALGRGFGWVIAGQALAGLGLTGNDIAWYPVVLEFAPSRRIDRYMGFYMTVFGIRALAGGLISGALMELSPVGSWIALIAGSMSMLGGAGMMLAFRRRSSPNERSADADASA